ncbi:MAG TPA: GntR family transcriptional regulator [Burkholderiaceae bacterium]|nr:GntR family transcriptional regulator [Burkholderiaceae bacterium]
MTQTSSLPFYAQIKETLRARILDGTYKPHQQMPSEAEMMATFKVSRITVRQALGDLQKEGLIFKLQGKGSFVSKAQAFQDLDRLQGFGEAMSRYGFETYNRLLSIKDVPAAPAVAAQLRIKPRTPVAEIKRVRFLNREPISLDVSYVSTALGERLRKADLATRDIFVIFENDYDIALGNAGLRIGAMLADATLAGLLKVEDGAPILRIERLTSTAGGEPLDFEYLYYRADAFQYRMRIERRNPSESRPTGGSSLIPSPSPADADEGRFAT